MPVSKKIQAIPPLSSLSTEAHQPRGAVLKTIIKAKALPATTMAAAL
jgi:hypothetical protein